jgi:hypothetical protein
MFSYKVGPLSRGHYGGKKRSMKRSRVHEIDSNDVGTESEKNPGCKTI